MDARDPEKYGWTSVMTLPWHLTPAEDNSLRIDPVEELKSLRYDEKRHSDMAISENQETVVEGFESDCMEIRLTIEPNDATRFGIKLLCSNLGEEETVVTYDAQQQEFVIDFENASEDKDLTYAGREDAHLPSGSWKQTVPYTLGNRALDLDIFVDRSVIEIFVNSEICMVQRVYPTRDDSKVFRLFTRDREIRAENIVKWEMDATNPW
jgi:sucrose-6-phosphate hydrolase SacC (GH32 family)